MLELLRTLEGKVAVLMEGKRAWPNPCFSQTFDYEGFEKANKEQVMGTMRMLFKVLGPAFEEFVTLAGYWDDSLAEAKLIGNAEKLVKHHQRLVFYEKVL